MIPAKRQALFLDRDGVINYDSGYTSNIENFIFIDGIFELCRSAKSAGYELFVVTNQAGIGRGFFSEHDFQILTKWMCDRFEENEASITEVFYCPYHPEFGIGQYKKDSFERKPNPGMLLRAANMYKLNLKESIIIGDKDSDMQAAERAGIGLRCHYITGGEHELVSKFATHSIRILQEGISLLRKSS
jgi:D-glycero-D-manno-heptose 1,7-bisphosphate phosphatase